MLADASVVRIQGGRQICGSPVIAGDKSICQRLAVLSLLARGQTQVSNFCPGQDSLATLTVMGQLGLEYRFLDQGLIIDGHDPDWSGRHFIDVKNSGTAARLIMGLGAFLQPGGSIEITGDQWLRRRPMERVAKFLRPMGVEIKYLNQPGRLPLQITCTQPVQALAHSIDIASAQVKSAILIASLAASGSTRIVQRPQSRDHTEVMLAALGADISWGETIHLRGNANLRLPKRWQIPGDISGACWWAAMAAVCGEVRIQGVGVNPTRTGFLDVIKAMGAQVELSNYRRYNGELVADLHVAAGKLQGVEVDPQSIPRWVDEVSALAVVAAWAEGTTIIRGVQELRYKESDRLAEIGRMLTAFGCSVRLLPDGFAVHGGNKLSPGCYSSSDHRMVMAALIMAAMVNGQSCIGDIGWLSISYPNFLQELQRHTGDGGC